MQIKKTSWVTVVMLGLGLLAASTEARANRLDISDLSVAGQNTGSDSLTIQMNLSWSNSWRDATNFDAVWVFIKYSTDAGVTWNHATMKTAGTNPSGFSQGTGTAVDLVVSADKKGFFVQRSSQSSGNVAVSGIQAVWDYGADGVSDDAAIAQDTIFKIFGIEMVYVPEAGFYVGDGSDGTQGQLEFGGAASSLPGAINSESGISFGNSAAQWYYNASAAPSAGEDADGTAFELSSAFPKGYAAFYAMKDEISEGQWIAFFNTLTTAQKTTRDLTANHAVQGGKNSDLTVDRNTISWTTQDAASSRADRACGYLSWQDLTAYADWAALRPMSELEYEKLCRGTAYPVVGEYAWGSASIVAAAAFSGSENGTETISTANANAHYSNLALGGGDGGIGPLRAGIFSSAGSVTRLLSGAGFYGNLELAGNLYERVVTIGNASGRSFAGSHGDGSLSSAASYEGNATNADWPGIDGTSASRGITDAAGSGLRGGSYAVGAGNVSKLAVSDRRRAADGGVTRQADTGGRCVRTA